MTKTPTIQTLLLLLLTLLTACNDPKPVTDALHRAEMLMNEHPDSALAVLNTLSPDAMGKNRTRAHYALLYTQAQDKNYIDETNDSLITIATDYYRHTDDVRRKFLSHYYKGRVLSNAGNYLDATSCYMEAEQLVDAVGDDYLVGLLYAEMGRIYRLYYDYPKSLEAYQKAAECYERAGKIRHRNYMWLNQSGVYRNINRCDESERLLRMTLASAQEEEDNVLVEFCMGDLVMLFIEEERMSEAQKLYEELKEIAEVDYGSAPFMGRLAEMYASEGQFVQAEACVEKGWERVDCCTDSINLYVASSELYSRQGRNDLAYEQLLEAMALQSEGAKQALQQPVLTAQCDFLSERLAFEAYKLRMEKRLNVLYLLVSTLVLGIVILVFFKVLRRKKQAITELEVQKREVEKEKDDVFLKFQQLNEEKKKADKTIEGLKNDISCKEKANNAKISTLIQKVKQGKEESKRNIEELKQEMARKDAESNRKITELLKDLAQGKEASERSIQKLEQELKEKEEEKNRSISSLNEIMKRERAESLQHIQALNDAVEEKEKNRQELESKLQMLEMNSKANTESMNQIRVELEQQVKRKTLHILELLGNDLNHQLEWMALHESQLANEDVRQNLIKERIAMLKQNYFVGEDAYRKLEETVNAYLDNAMLHFREEVGLAGENDYRRVCYMFAGISGQAIGEIMNESKDTVYQRRSRLLKRMLSFSCTHKEMFILLLSKQLKIKQM